MGQTYVPTIPRFPQKAGHIEGALLTLAKSVCFLEVSSILNNLEKVRTCWQAPRLGQALP